VSRRILSENTSFARKIQILSVFFIYKKLSALKKARVSKSGFKKTKSANLLEAAQPILPLRKWVIVQCLGNHFTISFKNAAVNSLPGIRTRFPNVKKCPKALQQIKVR